MPAALSHSRLWAGIDELARRKGLSASGLAKAAGLDPTAFNKSKRITPEGRPRWPSTESVWRVMQATGVSLGEITSLIEGEEEARRARAIPLSAFAKAGTLGHFDERGFPARDAWDEMTFPDLGNENVYALEVEGDGMAPVYRDGDIIVASPTASIRRGDRIIVKTTSGEIMARVLARRTAKTVELQALIAAHEPCVLAIEEVVWLARIIWASQ